MILFDFLLLCVASFRLTRFIVFDKLTDFIRRPFHDVIEEEADDGTIEEYIEVKGTGLKKYIGELLSCYWCTGFWCSLLLYVGYLYLYPLFYPLIVVFAIAGGASCIETLLQRNMDE